MAPAPFRCSSGIPVWSCHQGAPGSAGILARRPSEERPPRKGAGAQGGNLSGGSLPRKKPLRVLPGPRRAGSPRWARWRKRGLEPSRPAPTIERSVLRFGALLLEAPRPEPASSTEMAPAERGAPWGAEGGWSEERAPTTDRTAAASANQWRSSTWAQDVAEQRLERSTSAPRRPPFLTGRFETPFFRTHPWQCRASRSPPHVRPPEAQTQDSGPLNDATNSIPWVHQWC